MRTKFGERQHSPGKIACGGHGRAARLVEFRWLLDELPVSLFGWELRTAQPVSVKRLEKIRTRIGASSGRQPLCHLLDQPRIQACHGGCLTCRAVDGYRLAQAEVPLSGGQGGAGGRCQ